MSAKILLVDDDAGVLSALDRLLRRQGYEVTTFLRAEEALIACQRLQFDVVISDYRMPGLNGTQFLTQLRAVSPHATRMMLSGEADREAILASINEAGIFRFLVKPWDDQELVDTLALAVAEHNLKGEIDVALDSHRKVVDQDYRRKKAVEALEEETPGITNVNWSDDHTIVIEEES